MRYLCISECGAEEMEKGVRWDAALQAEREQNPDKYPRKVGDEYYIQGSLPRSETPYHVFLGLTIYESDTPEQMANLEARFGAIASELKTGRRWIMPIIEVGSVMERFMALRKLKTTSG